LGERDPKGTPERGRVGRGKSNSRFLLFATLTADKKYSARLTHLAVLHTVRAEIIKTARRDAAFLLLALRLQLWRIFMVNPSTLRQLNLHTLLFEI
jgi:hypothetical protein